MSDSKRSTLNILITLVVVAGLIALGYYYVSQQESGADEVVIGSLLALSGPDKSFGITQQQGMKIALDEVAEAGGIEGRPLRIEFADTQLNEDLGLQEYKRLSADPRIQAIVGVTGSGVALRIAPFANQNQIVLFSPLGTSPKLTDAGPYFFRNIASDAYSGVVLSEWVLEQGLEHAAVVYNTENAWSRGCSEAVESAYLAAGGSLVVEPTAALDSMENFNPIIFSFREVSPSPELVFVCLMGRQAGLFASQAKANQLDVPFYGTDTLSQQEFVDNAREALEQSFFVLPAEGGNERYEAFANEYRERYGAKADSIAAKAYDAIHVMAIALGNVVREGKDLTGANIRDSLSRVRYEGITGMNAFDQNGDLEHAEFNRLTYRDGEQVKL